MRWQARLEQKEDASRKKSIIETGMPGGAEDEEPKEGTGRREEGTCANGVHVRIHNEFTGTVANGLVVATVTDGTADREAGEW